MLARNSLILTIFACELVNMPVLARWQAEAYIYNNCQCLRMPAQETLTMQSLNTHTAQNF